MTAISNLQKYTTSMDFQERYIGIIKPNGFMTLKSGEQYP